MSRTQPFDVVCMQRRRVVCWPCLPLILPISLAWQPPQRGFALTLFNSTAVAGTILRSETVALPNVTHDSRRPFSATITGTISVERDYLYNFSCFFGDAVLGYVHVDGHLVCQKGTNGAHGPTPPSVRSTEYDNPLPVLSSTAWPIRLVVVHHGSASRPTDSFGVRITRAPERGGRPAGGGEGGGKGAAWLGGGTLRKEAWLEGALSPALPKEEAQRDS